MKTIKYIFVKLFFYQCLMLLIVGLNGCAFFAHARCVKVDIQAARYLNPDIHGEPSPVSLTLYELRNNTLFDKVVFFKLQDNSAEALQSTLIDQRSLMIRPEEQLNFKYQLSSDARYLGIVVGYRHLAFSEWKKIVALNEKSVKHLNIMLGSNSFIINNQ